jgi:hypothetical protein
VAPDFTGFYQKTPELRLGCRFGAKPGNPTAAKLFFLSGNKLHMVQMALLQGPLILIDDGKSSK